MPTLGAVAQNISSCCHRQNNDLTTIASFFNDQAHLDTMEKASAVALGLFSAIIAPAAFIASFAFGAIIGLFGRDAVMVDGNRTGYAVSSCSRGFMEGVAGVRLPPYLSLAANVAVMSAHIEHHSAVFVPITGVILGMWAGAAAAPTIDLYCRKIKKAMQA